MRDRLVPFSVLAKQGPWSSQGVSVQDWWLQRTPWQPGLPGHCTWNKASALALTLPLCNTQPGHSCSMILLLRWEHIDGIFFSTFLCAHDSPLPLCPLHASYPGSLPPPVSCSVSTCPKVFEQYTLFQTFYFPTHINIHLCANPSRHFFLTSVIINSRDTAICSDADGFSRMEYAHLSRWYLHSQELSPNK
jgi:hypothetical protein